MSNMVTSGAYPLRRTPTQDRANRQVERILDAACAEVVERGYDAASTSGIAKRAEIAVGSVYRYFPDKRSLIQAIERRNQARYTDAVRDRLALVSSWRAGGGRHAGHVPGDAPDRSWFQGRGAEWSG